MIRRYRVVLNVPNRFTGTISAVHIGSYRNVESALRRAESVLAKHPTTETRWSKERFPYHCSLYDAKGGTMPNGRGILVRRVYQDDSQNERLWAPVCIVPSVGELGYTP